MNNVKFVRVVVDGNCSSFLSGETGVTQGSVFGPILFLMHMNDIATHISSNKICGDDREVSLTVWALILNEDIRMLDL